MEKKSVTRWELCVELVLVVSGRFNGGVWCSSSSPSSGTKCRRAFHGGGDTLCCCSSWGDHQGELCSWRITVQFQEIWMYLQMHQLLRCKPSLTVSVTTQMIQWISICFFWYFPGEIHFSKSASAGCGGWSHKCNSPCTLTLTQWQTIRAKPLNRRLFPSAQSSCAVEKVSSRSPR